MNNYADRIDQLRTAYDDLTLSIRHLRQLEAALAESCDTELLTQLISADIPHVSPAAVRVLGRQVAAQILQSGNNE